MKAIRSILAGVFALGTVFAAPALAQSDGSGKPVGPTDTKQFGDWVVRCFPVNSPSPCDMFELLANKKTKQRIMSVSVAYVPSSDKHVIQISVPLGVLIQKGAVVTSDDYSSPMLHYRRCDRGGCYVEMLLPPDLLNALSSGSGAKVRIIAEGGKSFEIPFSLKGFADAHGAMTDLARKKALKPAEQPAAPAPAAPDAPDASTPAPDQTPAPTP
ncbi:MAG TPA: invasion associated locus B family protein [Rhizomicrobium sp.]